MRAKTKKQVKESVFEKQENASHAQDTISAEQRYLIPEQAAELMGIKVSLLSNWRVSGEGPCYVKLGSGIRGLIRYPLNGPKGLYSYMENRIRSSTSEIIDE